MTIHRSSLCATPTTTTTACRQYDALVASNRIFNVTKRNAPAGLPDSDFNSADAESAMQYFRLGLLHVFWIPGNTRETREILHQSFFFGKRVKWDSFQIGDLTIEHHDVQVDLGLDKYKYTTIQHHRHIKETARRWAATTKSKLVQSGGSIGSKDSVS